MAKITYKDQMRCHLLRDYLPQSELKQCNCGGQSGDHAVDCPINMNGDKK